MLCIAHKVAHRKMQRDLDFGCSNLWFGPDWHQRKMHAWLPIIKGKPVGPALDGSKSTPTYSIMTQNKLTLRWLVGDKTARIQCFSIKRRIIDTRAWTFHGWVQYIYTTLNCFVNVKWNLLLLFIGIIRISLLIGIIKIGIIKVLRLIGIIRI